MNTNTAFENTVPLLAPGFPPVPGKSPWTSDLVLLGLSVWWVKSTRPESEYMDFENEVSAVFSSLQRELQ